VADGKPERVADRWQDTMGFAVVGPDHFLASGHPDLREDLPAHLGLIESTDSALYVSDDRAVSWQATTPVSGDARALAVSPQAWYVATSHGVYRSTDTGRSWKP
jgi:hypothetical protein